MLPVLRGALGRVELAARPTHHVGVDAAAMSSRVLSRAQSISERGHARLGQLVEVDDEKTLEHRLSDAESRELVVLGTTVYGLLVTYVQQASIISAHPAATFWASNWWFGWLRFFSVDFFSFLEVPDNPALTIQYKLLGAIVPVGVLLYVSEYFWLDHTNWRHLYVDNWKATRDGLSAMRPLLPAFPKMLSAVSTGCAVMVVATPVTVSTALTVFLGFFLAQLLLGEVNLFFIKFARVVYNELRYDDDVDNRPDFFYRVRIECRHLAITVLNMWYLLRRKFLFT